MREYHKKINKGMFDFEDFYQAMAEELPDCARVCEIGVGEGASAIFMAETLLNLKKHSFCYWIDDLTYGGENQFVKLWNNIYKAGLNTNVELFPIDSLKAASFFQDNFFNFVYIDSSHRYEATKNEIRLWYHKVKDGGILAGHDYKSNPSVKKAVDEVVPKDHLKTNVETPFGYWYFKKTENVQLS